LQLTGSHKECIPLYVVVGAESECGLSRRIKN
jgi:hypothetical protein